METNIDRATLEALRAGLRGTAYSPGDEGYDEGRQGFNLNAHQHPALVVMVEGAFDVVSAVRLARQQGLGIGVIATGHGVASPCDGGILINTSRMRGVRVDPESQSARVEPGAVWSDVIPKAQEHGLVGLSGSSSGVGVVGFMLGGGYGWLGRKYGFAAESVREAEVVTASGERVKASADENADLFWGLKGGGGNFGIVTSLEFSLYPLSTVYGGGIYYPVEKAPEVLDLYARWVSELPDEMTTSITFLNFPPLPALPEALRGNSVISVRACYCGDPPEVGEKLIRPVREELGEPVMDGFRTMPCGEMDSISMDPTDPVGAYGHVELLGDLSPDTIATLVEVAGANSNTPLTSLELRELGGALALTSSDLSPLGHAGSKFIMNGIGMTPTPEAAKKVQSYLAYVAESARAHETGATYVNFLELDGATPERVKAAYSTEDWKRLVSLKDRYDPHNTFRFNRNIPPSSEVR
ncbi:MAG TPA: FAD-binding oxidoreductase [Rubrobacter sp.]|nr:FAD-binding oxidoreductase [Rubrobacter sp.]